MKKLSATIMVVGLLLMVVSPAQAIDVREYGYNESLGRWVRQTVGASGSSLVEIIADGDTIGSTDNALLVKDIATSPGALSVDTNTSVSLPPGDTYTFSSSTSYKEYSITPVGGNVHYREDTVATTNNDIVIDSSKLFQDGTEPTSVNVIASDDNADTIDVYFRGLVK